MRDLLRRYSLIGYHCTKLTREEIESVRNDGLLLQNAISLNRRIDRLQSAGAINAKVATCLKQNNQADDPYRAKMLWFCFFEPYIAGQGGIERLFRSWGGEALYNSHERDPVTGSTLLSIGTPCVVKACVPIDFLKDSHFPDTSMIRAFLSHRGHQLENPIEHEGFSTKNIPSSNILGVFEYPGTQFIRLTQCDEWENGLSVE